MELVFGQGRRLEDVADRSTGGDTGHGEVVDAGDEHGVALMDQVEREFADVQAALDRLEDGTYATCERCGGAIEAARLEAVPLGRLCAVHA